MKNLKITEKNLLKLSKDPLSNYYLDILYAKRKEENAIFKKLNVPFRNRNDKDDNGDYLSEELVSADKFLDACELITILSGLLLDEREKRKQLIKDLKSDITSVLNTANEDFGF
jgi:hypothetical protein